MVGKFQLEEDFFERLMDMLEAQFGTNTEIVLHDLRKKYDRTIVDIRNGYITGRKIGGLENGHVLRSSSLYFRNDKGEIIGSLCINTDITPTLQFEEYLHEYNRYDIPDDDETEFFANDVGELLEYLILQTTKKIGKPPKEMNRDDKKKFMELLDNKGAFLISKSSERIQEYLGISKFTFYKYLGEIRTKN